MTKDVHQCLLFSMAYKTVGKTHPRNQPLIIVLQVPEPEAMSTRDHPRFNLNKQKATR